MDSKEFGARLRELRRQAGFSQRELANKIGVNFTYLSKIESGAMPPPSEKVIQRLTEALNADKDELMTLAGKIPSDIAQILKTREALQFLRSGRTQKKIGAASKKEGSGMMKNLVNYKSLSKIAIPIVLVCAVAASLWFASPLPAKALEITFPTLPSGTLGGTHSFTIKLDLASAELVPIQSVDLQIYNVADTSKTVDCTSLPLNDGGTKSYSNTATGGGTVSVTATSPNDTWAYFSGTGYSYWKGTGYSFGTTFGYGYQTGAATITYNITWTSPAGWPGGGYKARVTIAATSDVRSETFIETSSSFTLSAAGEYEELAEIIVTPGPVVVVLEPGVIDVSDIVTPQGEFTDNVTLESEDGNLTITINEGTTGTTADGEPISIITVNEVADPPSAPADANVIGVVFDIDADGATFDEPITITFTYDPDDIPAGLSAEDLVISYWDPVDARWVDLPTVVGPDNTIIAEVDHLSIFAILAREAVVEEEVIEEEVIEEEVVEEEVVEEEVIEEEVVEEEVVVPEEEEVVPEEEEVVPPAPIAWWVWVIVGVAAITVVVIIGLVIRRRRV